MLIAAVIVTFDDVELKCTIRDFPVQTYLIWKVRNENESGGIGM